jgi:alkanesulfonate monooxygenase SsuD/methylene tetrahydromethanopterin reductase-like flavin-dependent oxidoreductase (luciferase family)
MDHYFQMDRVTAAEEPMLEAYTTLSYVAALTGRMTLGVLVTGVMYRYPGILAKIVATLDVLSGGRSRLGIGASWYEREQRGLGVPVVPVAERFERLEETLQICLQM